MHHTEVSSSSPDQSFHVINVERSIVCVVVTTRRTAIRWHGFCSQEMQNPVPFISSTREVHHYDDCLDKIVCLFHYPEGMNVVRAFLATQRRPYWIYILEIERGLVPLAPLATPMVIESKCMSLSQIQKQLCPF